MKFSFKPQWHQILISLLIGLCAGVALDKQCSSPSFRKNWKDGSMKERMLQKLDKELHLNESQEAQIKMIFEQKHPKMVALHDEMRPKFEAVKTETESEIRKVLNEEQIPKFETLCKKWEERRKNRTSMGPPSGM